MNSPQVPVFDIRNVPDDTATLRDLDGACREWGFFQVTGHGIPPSLLAAAHTQMVAFFALPDSAKQAIVRTAENPWGFYDQELTKNRRDWKQIFDVGPTVDDGPLAGTRPQWPDALPQFRPAILALSAAFETIAYRVLQGIALNLDVLPAHLFDAFGARHTSFLRLNYYPPCNDPAPPDSPTVPTHGHLAINHHTDSGALTVLLQDDQPGLQVQQGDGWHLVEPRPDALVINIGDIVQVWSNDRYVAPVHRVIASRTNPRYTAPFFFNPSPETNYAPLPGACRGAPHYRPINWGDFRAGRAAGDYADLGAEIQIADFRLETP